jgi:hypothetical protein
MRHADTTLGRWRSDRWSGHSGQHQSKQQNKQHEVTNHFYASSNQAWIRDDKHDSHPQSSYWLTTYP